MAAGFNYRARQKQQIDVNDAEKLQIKKRFRLAKLELG